MKFLPNPSPFDNENVTNASNLMPYGEYEYLLGSPFLVNLAAPNKELLIAIKSPTWYEHFVDNGKT